MPTRGTDSRNFRSSFIAKTRMLCETARCHLDDNGGGWVVRTPSGSFMSNDHGVEDAKFPWCAVFQTPQQLDSYLTDRLDYRFSNARHSYEIMSLHDALLGVWVDMTDILEKLEAE